MSGRFRKRPFRKPVNRPAQARLNAHPLLKKAHEQYAEGQYIEAADTFEFAAKEIHSRNGIIPPQLFLQAGRARLIGEQAPEGMELIRRAMQILAQRKQYPRISMNIVSTFDILDRLGYNEELENFKKWVDEYFPGLKGGRQVAQLKQKKIGLLPAVCPSCGGQIHPEEVEWLNDRQAECAYCGTLVKTEG